MSKSLNSLIADLKEIAAIADPLLKQWRLIHLRKYYGLTIKEFAEIQSLAKEQEADQ